jgi:hypothetical protein
MDGSLRDEPPPKTPVPPTAQMLPVGASPFCRHLRSKKSYFLRRPPETEADLLDGSGHCWCLRTMIVLGPDGRPVEPAECRSGRPCFESIL